MRLKNLIVEAKERSVAISPEEAFDGIRAHCKSALADHKNNKRVYRGMYADQNIYIVKPGEHTRMSRNTFNTYTLLIDHSKKWAKYPKRSKSIICSTEESGAGGYGNPYIVFPKDGYKFGVCPANDMWNSFKAHIKENLSIFNDKLERYIHELEIDFHIDYMTKYEDLELMCKKIDMVLQNTQERNTRAFEWIFEYDRYGNFMDLLEFLFDPEDNGFKITSDIGGLPQNETEVWTDSESYLISLDWLMAGNNNGLIG